MYLSFSVDWLHVTNPYSEVRPLPMNLYPLKVMRELSYTTPRYGYTMAATNQLGAKVMVNPDRPDMGVHVSYSAGTLREYASKDIDTLAILRWHIALGARVSRIDLALDVHDSDLSIVALYEQMQQGTALTRAQNFTLLKAQDNGATLYIGSRSSAVLLRIYDKAREQGVIANWKRIELEAKGDKANEISRLLCESEPDRVLHLAKRLIVGIVSFADPAWSELLGSQDTAIAPANKRETDTVNWLLKVAAPSLGRHVGRTGNTAVMAEFLRIVRVHRFERVRDD